LLIRLYTATGRVMVRAIGASAGRLDAGRIATHDSREGSLADNPVPRSRITRINAGLAGN
jgi:hypothetical protein